MSSKGVKCSPQHEAQIRESVQAAIASGSQSKVWKDTEASLLLFAQDRLPVACHWLGELYLAQDSSTETKRKAAGLFRLAADNNYSFSQVRLAELVYEGSKYPKHHLEAMKLFKAAADQGHPQGQYKYGLHLSISRCSKSDTSLAFHYLTLAANQGVSQANYVLGRLYDKTERELKYAVLATKHYYVAAESGIADAQYRIGLRHLTGYTVWESWQLEMYWYSKAAEQGHIPAVYALAHVYEHCLPGEHGIRHAHRLYLMAASHEYQPAIEQLRQMKFCRL